MWQQWHYHQVWDLSNCWKKYLRPIERIHFFNYLKKASAVLRCLFFNSNAILHYSLTDSIAFLNFILIVCLHFGCPGCFIYACVMYDYVRKRRVTSYPPRLESSQAAQSSTTWLPTKCEVFRRLRKEPSSSECHTYSLDLISGLIWHQEILIFLQPLI